VIEERRLEKLEHVSEYILTYHHIEKIKKEIEEARIKTTKRSIFETIDNVCEKKGVVAKKMVTIGQYSKEILKAVKKHKIDLIVLEFVRSSLLYFQIFEKSPVPVWVEGVKH